ncbi:MAG: sigma-70 family RNA polymerase sigma factor [Bryobacterales bacterium]|jgi:RNA polymerase sigma factor for flagellar operon FliA|nr:sigma-70 family RNA polymerase sigma factor [Bryobacterales bacterium]
MANTTNPTYVNAAREERILSHLPLVRRIAREIHRQCPRTVALEDLVSAGTIGLIQAADRYDAARGTQLGTLADRRIRGAILDHLRGLDPLPRALRRFVRKLQECRARLRAELGREPEEAEIAEAMRIPLDAYRRRTEEADREYIYSLDDPNTERRNQPAIPPSKAAEHSILRVQILRLSRQLPAPQATVIEARLHNRSHESIAIELGVTQGRVSQIQKLAIDTLAAMVSAPSATPAPPG